MDPTLQRPSLVALTFGEAEHNLSTKTGRLRTKLSLGQNETDESRQINQPRWLRPLPRPLGIDHEFDDYRSRITLHKKPADAGLTIGIGTNTSAITFD
jgi:hypothetical protein